MQLTHEIQSSIPYQYALSVRSGEKVVGKTIRQAVERFFSWIETAQEDGFYLDHKAGMHFIEFCEYFIKHTKGPLAGEPFILSPYQQFTYYNIFGWKDLSGRRRINTVYDKQGRKNGKTAPMAALGLYCLTFDDEDSPEIYAAATKEAQAKVCWEQAYDFVYKSHPLRQIGVRNTQREIRFEKKLGKFRFLGGDSKTQDGLSPSMACVDEYHAHKDDSIREVLESAMGARTNPILYIITTAGFNTQSACKHAEDVYKEILSGIKKDDHTFIMIHDLDEGDDWEDEANWFKANPNLNISISLEYLRSEYTKAKNQPSKIPNFKTKHLNMWVDAAEVRIPEEIWDQNSGKIQIKNFLRGGSVIGLDLSTTKDLTAAVAVSEPDEDGVRDVLPLIFCPFDTVDVRSKEDKVPYRFWKDLNLSSFIDFTGTDLENDPFFKKVTCLTATPGNQIDYETLEEYLKYFYTVLNAKWINYDRHNATQLVQNITDEGFKMFPFAQTIIYYSAPTKEFERLAHLGKLRTGGHPILKWSLSGCVVKMNPNEDIRYDKSLATKRIDPIIGTIMGLAGTMMEEETNESKYNSDTEEIFI